MIRLSLKPVSFLDNASCAALGLGLYAQAVFVLAWAGLLNPPALAVLTAVAALAVRPPAFPKRIPINPAAGVLAFAFFSTLITALAPPVEWDVLAYHLALPELYLKASRLTPVPWMIHSHWPHLMELLYSVPLAAGRDGAAALLHLGAAALLIAAVSVAGGWPAALLLAGQPALLRSAGTAHADAATSLFVFAGAHTLSLWEEKRTDGALIAAGLLAGLAACSKLLGVAALGAWAVYLLWKTRRAREAALFSACGALMLGPWLLFTWLSSGDPVWPFLRHGAEAAALAARYVRSNRWDFPPPVTLFAHDGPGFLVLPVFGLLALSRASRPAASRLERLLWTAAPAYAILAWRHNEAWRFLTPVWPALALAGARGAASALTGGYARRCAALVLIAAAALPIAELSPNNALFAVAGVRPASAPDADRREFFRERSIDVAAFYREARALVPSGANVLLFREVRGYRAGFDYSWGDPMNQALIDYRRIAGPEELAARLRAHGVTYVLDHAGSTLYREDPGYYDARTLGLMSAFLARDAKPVLTRDGLTLYALR